MSATCAVEDCEGTPLALTYCEPHYRRFKRHGNPTAGRTRRRRDEIRTCELDDCDEPHRANGLCNKHMCRRAYWGDCEWSAMSVDDIAVERAVLGEPPAKLTQGEREQAVAKLAGRMHDREIARRIGMSLRGVQVIRYRLKLPAKRRPARIRVGAGAESRLFLAHPWIEENVARKRNYVRAAAS